MDLYAVENITRLQNTANGNPRWKLKLHPVNGGKSISRSTRKDANFNFWISPNIEGQTVMVDFDSTGLISDIASANMR